MLVVSGKVNIMSWQEIISTFPASTVEHQVLKSIDDFIHSQNLVILVAFLKTISFIVTVFFLTLILYLYVKTNVFGEKLKSIKSVFSSKPGTLNKKISSSFERIKVRLKNNLAEDDKAAVIEADSCLLEAMKSLGLSVGSGGQDRTFAEMVSDKSLWSTASVSEILQAHEIRNLAVHFSEPLAHAEATDAVESFEKALKDLGFL